MHEKLESLKFLKSDEIGEIVKRFGSPVFIYDQTTMHHSFIHFQNIPNAFGLTVRYSVKANPNATILRLFDKYGAHFDVSSVWEAKRAQAAGIDPKKILLTAQEVSVGWEQLCDAGMEFDAGSLLQLEMYGKRYPGKTVSIRINPGFGSGLVKKLTSGGIHSSFGIWNSYLDQVIQTAEKYHLHIRRVHTHIGSGHDGAVLEKIVSTILEICRRIPSIEIVNLGGGYKITSLRTDPDYDHHGMGARIAAQLHQFYEETGRALSIELEPGTYLMSLAGSLITTIIDKTDTGAEGYEFLKLDAGLTELIRPSYYGALHPMVVVPAHGKEPDSIQDYLVCGHCCIAGDNLTPVQGSSEDFAPVPLLNAHIGDHLVVERAGGYASSMSIKNFNSYPEIPEVLRSGYGEYFLIRQRQTFNQLIQNEINLEQYDTHCLIAHRLS